DRAVVGDGQVDLRVDRGAQLRQFRFHRIHDIDDVRTRLLIDLHGYGRLAVVEAIGTDVFRSAVLHVQNRSDISQAHGRAVSVRYDEVAVGLGIARVVVRIDLIVQLVGFDRSLGSVGIRIGNGCPDILQADAVLRYGQRVDLHPDGGQSGATD